MAFRNMNHLGHARQASEEIAVKNAIAVSTERRPMSGERLAFVKTFVSRNRF
jgi:hypothetical protein